MKKMCEEGAVVTCNSVKCSWNESEECHAPRIEVGSSGPECETFTIQTISNVAHKTAAVDYCDMSDCGLNRETICLASGITVGNHTGHADCITFRPKESNGH